MRPRQKDWRVSRVVAEILAQRFPGDPFGLALPWSVEQLAQFVDEGVVSEAAGRRESANNRCASAINASWARTAASSSAVRSVMAPAPRNNVGSVAIVSVVVLVRTTPVVAVQPERQRVSALS